MEESSETKNHLFLDFLEIAFHTILYSRNIYPPSIFSLKKKFGIGVHVLIHPDVLDYLSQCFQSIRAVIDNDNNDVHQVRLIVKSKEKTIERHVFEFISCNPAQSDDFYMETEQCFRDYLLKMSVVNEHLHKTPEDATFVVEVVTNGQAAVRLNETIAMEHFPWVEVDGKIDSTRQYNIVPVKTLSNNHLGLQMFIET